MLRQFYTHEGTERLRILPGQTVGLDITDPHGRHVTGTATMSSVVPVDSLRYKFKR